MTFFTHAIPRHPLSPVFALVFAVAAVLPAPSALASETPPESIVAESIVAEAAAVEAAPLTSAGETSASPDVPTLIAATAIRWNLPADRLLRIAWCESRWDPTAVSYAGHLGLFQFAHPTWHVASQAVGLPDASPFDPAANVEAAAWLMSTDGFHHWGCL